MLPQEPVYPQDKLLEDREYVIKKLAITEERFEQIMRAPPRTFLEYPTHYHLLEQVKKVRNANPRRPSPTARRCVMLRYLAIAVLLTPLLGIWLMEGGAYGPSIGAYGAPNGANAGLQRLRCNSCPPARLVTRCMPLKHAIPALPLPLRDREFQRAAIAVLIINFVFLGVLLFGAGGYRVLLVPGLQRRVPYYPRRHRRTGLPAAAKPHPRPMCAGCCPVHGQLAASRAAPLAFSQPPGHGVCRRAHLGLQVDAYHHVAADAGPAVLADHLDAARDPRRCGLRRAAGTVPVLRCGCGGCCEPRSISSGGA